MTDRNTLFRLEYRDFSITAGGRPAFILAVGTPLTLIPLFVLMLNPTLTWKLWGLLAFAMALFAVLAGVWVWYEMRDDRTE